MLKSRKVRGVRFLVLGTVVRLGNLAVSARMVDAVTGEIVQTADIAADDAMGLQNSLAELAAVLQMSPEEKQAYLDDKASRAEAAA